MTESSANYNDLHELEEWMERYGRDVMSTAYAYVKNYHQAQDIVQDVFLRAYTKRDSFRGDSTLRTWLLSITVNRCKDYLRSWAVRHEQQAESTIEQVSPVNIEAEVMARFTRDELWHALHQLPDKYREAIVLYYIQGLSGQEVATVLRTTDQNVRTRLHRGRVLLKELLSQRGDTRDAR